MPNEERSSELLRQVDLAIEEAVRQERERILAIVDEEASHYSPLTTGWSSARATAMVFANAVRSKVMAQKG